MGNNNNDDEMDDIIEHIDIRVKCRICDYYSI